MYNKGKKCVVFLITVVYLLTLCSCNANAKIDSLDNKNGNVDGSDNTSVNVDSTDNTNDSIDISDQLIFKKVDSEKLGTKYLYQGNKPDAGELHIFCANDNSTFYGYSIFAYETEIPSEYNFYKCDYREPVDENFSMLFSAINTEEYLDDRVFSGCYRCSNEYVFYDISGPEEPRIESYNIRTGETSVIYSFDGNYYFDIAYGDGYLTWMDWDINDTLSVYGYNVDTNDIFLIANNIQAYNAYTTYEICDGIVSYVIKENEVYKIVLYDLLNREIVYVYDVPLSALVATPKSNGRFLVYNNACSNNADKGVYVVDLLTGDEKKVVLDGVTVKDAWLFLSENVLAVKYHIRGNVGYNLSIINLDTNEYCDCVVDDFFPIDMTESGNIVYCVDQTEVTYFQISTNN